MSPLEVAKPESEHENGRISWQVAHAALSRLAKQRAVADAEEGRWLLAAERAAVHVYLGYGSFTEYVERLFGYRPRSIQEKLRVAALLEDLPVCAQALSQGDISWSALRELTRVAVCETEREWLEFARGKTLRQLEQVLADKRPGATPVSPPDPAARRHVLRFEVAAETFALFREALSELRRRGAAALDDDSALLELARHVLGGPREDGRAGYQIVLQVCPECGSGGQYGAGRLVPVGADVIQMAQCDAQHISLLDAEQSAVPANDLEPGERRGARAAQVESAPEFPQEILLNDESPSNGSPDIASEEPAEAGSAEVASLEAVSTETASPEPARAGASTRVRESPSPSAHVGAALDEPGAAGRAQPSRTPRTTPSIQGGARARARQSIPPARRRAVLLRDQHRCQVPGCTHASWVDIHHIELRSEGGLDSLENLTCLCSAHHRAVHRGKLSLKRGEGGALRVRHAEGTEYGRPVNPGVLEARAKVFSALRQLGFREGEVRAALEQLQRESAEAAPPQASVDGLLRAALARLHSFRMGTDPH